MESPRAALSPSLLDALRCAATWHAGQTRKGAPVPYVEHLFAVALMLARQSWAEEVVIAGLLHDAVEDTNASLSEIAERFGAVVARIVHECSEVKYDADGRKRPWMDRKRDHLASLASSSLEARAVLLADKLHNLQTIEGDLRAGRVVWPLFSAAREEVLWYYRAMIDVLDADDNRLRCLAAGCRAVLAIIGAYPETSADS